MLWCPIAAVWSFGLGDLTIRSPLNASLVAEINLLMVDTSELDKVQVELASAGDFLSAGIQRTKALDEMTFKVSVRDDGSAMVEITSLLPMTGAYLQLLVAADWKDNRVVREYTMLLDLPMDDGTIPAKIIGPEIPVAEFIEQFDKGKDLNRRSLSRVKAGQPYGPIKRGEYLITVGNALDLPSTISIYQRLYAILKGNPHAFINRNMNLLRAGVVLDIPTADQMSAVPRVLAMEVFTRQVAEWQEYRLKFEQFPDDVEKYDLDAPGLAVMKATIVELENEISRLRQQLKQTISEQNESTAGQIDVAQYRETLTDDIRRLEAARDRLLGTIDTLPGVSESVQNLVSDNQALPTSQSEKAVLSKNLENEELQEQVLLLEKQVRKAVDLLRAQDEALLLAQQEAAVYGAALEAREYTAKETSEALGEEVEGSGTTQLRPSSDDPKIAEELETVAEKEQKVVNRVVGFLYDEPNRWVLFGVGVAVLLLLFMAMRRRRINQQPDALEMSGAIESVTRVADSLEDTDNATKLDLARAYVEMGDRESAHKLLLEISAVGDADQQAEVKRLRDVLDD